MRISSLLLLVPLAACGQPEQEQARAAEQRAVEAAPKLFCAQGGGALVAACTAERTSTAQGWVLTLRHPDGHFRRLLVTDDGRTITAADGAVPARVTSGPEGVEVSIADDRYRLPAP
jgi:putative hemolysin